MFGLCTNRRGMAGACAASAPITDQLRAFYGEAEVEAAVARLMGFRALLQQPSASGHPANHRRGTRQVEATVEGSLDAAGVEHGVQDYQYMDGEFVAAWALGTISEEKSSTGPSCCRRCKICACSTRVRPPDHVRIRFPFSATG